MNRLLKKIPITFWTLLLIFLCSYLIFKDVISIDNTKLDIITHILTILGIYYLAIQVSNQTKSEKISNEFLNQTNFEFSGFDTDKIEDSQPCLCCEPGTLNYNQCSDIHWFNFKQIGNLPAKNLKMIIVHEKGIQDIRQILKSSIYIPMIYKNDEHQLKLNPHLIPLVHLDLKVNGKFYVLIEYSSVYTNIRYKRVYSLDYTPAVGPTTIPITWVKNIRYFSMCLEQLSDSETTTWGETFKNLGNKLLKSVNIKSTLTIEEWLLDI